MHIQFVHHISNFIIVFALFSDLFVTEYRNMSLSRVNVVEEDRSIKSKSLPVKLGSGF